jgi:spore coat protein CotF
MMFAMILKCPHCQARLFEVENIAPEKRIRETKPTKEMIASELLVQLRKRGNEATVASIKKHSRKIRSVASRTLMQAIVLLEESKAITTTNKKHRGRYFLALKIKNEEA